MVSRRFLHIKIVLNGLIAPFFNYLLVSSFLTSNTAVFENLLTDSIALSQTDFVEYPSDTQRSLVDDE